MRRRIILPPLDLSALHILRGRRLLLRPPQASDREAIFAYASQPKVCHYLAWRCHESLADTDAFLSQAASGWESGERLTWLIEDESGVVGSIGAVLKGRNGGVGYVLAEPVWGRGYASEALGVVTTALFHHAPIRRLMALCVTDNLASARVLEKNGFVCERTIPRYFTCPNLAGERFDVFLFAHER